MPPSPGPLTIDAERYLEQLSPLPTSGEVKVTSRLIGVHARGKGNGFVETESQVVDADGNPPGIGRALLRTVLRVIEVNPFVFGAIPAGIAVLASPNRQRLGDMAAGTFVVPHDFRSKIAPAQVFS